jgi:hypothetical protein
MLGGLLRWLQLTIEPAYHSVGFQEIGPAAVRTLERALFLPIERERQNQKCPAVGTSRSFSLVHDYDPGAGSRTSSIANTPAVRAFHRRNAAILQGNRRSLPGSPWL